VRVLHGFNGTNVVAAFTEAPGGGNILDINAPRNAPAKAPASHLDKVAFHSDFYLYERAIDTAVTVHHAAIPTAAVDWFAWPGVPTGFQVLGRAVETSHVLLNHGLGYTPLVMVALGGAVLVCGTIVQTSTAGTRFVSVYADNQYVGLGEAGYANEVDVPAVSLIYRVVVFKTPQPDPDKALFSGNATQFQAGRGRVDSTKRYLKRVTPSASDLDMDMSQTTDVANGGSRVVTGGNVQTDRFYNGSFAGGGFIPVDF